MIMSLRNKLFWKNEILNDKKPCSTCHGFSCSVLAFSIWFPWNHKRKILHAIFVRVLFLVWVRWITGLTNRELHFGIGIILGTIPSGFPVSQVIVSGCSRNSSRACPYLRVQKKFLKFGQSTQNMWLRSAKFLGQFFSDPAFDFLWKLGDALFSHHRNERVL